MDKREESEMAAKLILLAVFFAVMIYVGVASRKHASSVSDFVLGGRNVGPWLLIWPIVIFSFSYLFRFRR